jgi:hypothetical protein
MSISRFLSETSAAAARISAAGMPHIICLFSASESRSIEPLPFSGRVSLPFQAVPSVVAAGSNVSQPNEMLGRQFNFSAGATIGRPQGRNRRGIRTHVARTLVANGGLMLYQIHDRRQLALRRCVTSFSSACQRADIVGNISRLAVKRKSGNRFIGAPRRKGDGNICAGNEIDCTNPKRERGSC